ncbi:MAG TPA: AIR synthase related protein, partial [Nakamurella sp.]|nr:AIR synthase related protein [Nakamurella sp.]
MTTAHHPLGSGATYAGSGVSIAAGEAAVDLMKPYTKKTHRSEVIGGIGGFAALFRMPIHRFRDPVLASSTDGVGTKSAIAQAMDVHDTIGIDLVAMVVDDLVACGAEPLFLQDYIACGKLEPQRIASIVSGIAEGCVRAGCALVGGETAEHPGLMAPDDYDLAATAVGVVE